MELCACGAKRWVDLQGRPATPWQFINLGARPTGQEGARAAPRTSPKSVLDGLINCGSCGQPTALDDTQGAQETSYACQGPCTTPRLRAHRVKALLVCTVLETVLTEDNISRVLAVANAPRRYEKARERRLTRKDVQEPVVSTESLVPAADMTQQSRDEPAGDQTAGGHAIKNKPAQKMGN